MATFTTAAQPNAAFGSCYRFAVRHDFCSSWRSLRSAWTSLRNGLLSRLLRSRTRPSAAATGLRCATFFCSSWRSLRSAWTSLRNGLLSRLLRSRTQPSAAATGLRCATIFVAAGVACVRHGHHCAMAYCHDCCAAERALRQLLQVCGAPRFFVAAGAACVRLRSSRKITANTHPTADNHEHVLPVPLEQDWRRHIELAVSRPPPGEPLDRDSPSATNDHFAPAPD